MPHARETLRKAIVTAVTGLTTTGARVTSRQLHAVRVDALPALAVNVATGEGETVSGVIADEFSTTHVRRLPVEVVAFVASLGAYEDTLDTICLEVETALWASAGVAALILDMRLVSTTIEVSGEAERPVATAKMAWEFSFAVNESAPTASI